VSYSTREKYLEERLKEAEAVIMLISNECSCYVCGASEETRQYLDKYKGEE
jgi:sulfite reductase alpha subunit-like flavoprotein